MHWQPAPGVPRAHVLELQKERLSLLLTQVLPCNGFYHRKFAAAGLDGPAYKMVDDLQRLPFTTKTELLADQAENPPFGRIHTHPVHEYTRYHQTSGTSGQPLRWLDTADSWSALLDVWTGLFQIAGITPKDRLFFPFSFGPFLGFWSAFDAGTRFGCLCLPGGGMSSTARLRFILDNRPTVVFCTPTYALHLAEVARNEGIDLPDAGVRAIVVAGEPGGSILFTRQRIEIGWGARLFDHNGMTETGPLGIECEEAPGGLHLLETACVAEVIDPDGRPVSPGTPGELVMTTLTRPGSPLIRYRTGDLVCVDPRPCPCGRPLIRLDAGIHGRVDDMIIIRGNNVHPASLQRILHRFPEVAEYRVEVDATAALPALRIQVEPHANVVDASQLTARLDRAIRDELLFRAEIETVTPGTLPRFELKARRVVWKTPSASGGGTPSSPQKS
jgi:phenylacetate-CoA ligase